MSVRQIFGRAFVRGNVVDDTLLTIDGGDIVDVVQTASIPAGALRTHGLITPGFIDLHIHGADGADFMDAASDGNFRIAAHHARHGTTALAATTLSASKPDLLAAVRQISRSAVTIRAGAAQIVGLHLEGPYIARSRAGAQELSAIRPPDIEELETLFREAPDLRWLVTLAPEVEGAEMLMERFRDRVTLSIGHTAADYGQSVAGLAWGATHFTHLFNAMTGLGHRAPGAVGAAMVSADATAEIIADGIHVHPAVIRVAATAMPHRIVLVTDAIRACGLDDGTYKLYGHDVVVSEGAARLADGTLAGSVLTMHDAVRNMVELVGLPIEVVLPFATEVPARTLGIGEQKGRLARGLDADLVILDDKLGLERVFTRGDEVA